MQTEITSDPFFNKVALVTGGSSGIGYAIAKELKAQGATVIITGRDALRLERAAKQIGGSVWTILADVTRTSETEALMEQVKRDHGRLDLLIPNAGEGEVAKLGSITEDHIDRIFATNVKGVIFTVQGALPLMSEGGAIILIGSSASIDPPLGMSVYGATKSALRNLMRAWVAETKDLGIRINAVSPGPTRTPGLNEYFSLNPAALDYLTAQSTVGRLGEPEDVARAVAFLGSDQAGYINGIELFVDGGASQI